MAGRQGTHEPVGAVLDGATYLLLALTLAVGLPLVQANAVKTFALVPTSLLALVIFAAKGHVDWEVGAVMAVTAVAGGLLGAKLTMSPAARTWVFRLLVLVILGELVHLTIHYVFERLSLQPPGHTNAPRISGRRESASGAPRSRLA